MTRRADLPLIIALGRWTVDDLRTATGPAFCGRWSGSRLFYLPPLVRPDLLSSRPGPATPYQIQKRGRRTQMKVIDRSAHAGTRRHRKFRRLLLTVSASLLLVVTGVTSAAVGVSEQSGRTSEATTNQPDQQAPPTAHASTVVDCFYYSGAKRGCTYFNPDNFQARICDYQPSQEASGNRYTRGHVSVEGVLDVDEYMYIAGCTSPLPVTRPGTRICIRTGVEGLGWTKPECRTTVG